MKDTAAAIEMYHLVQEFQILKDGRIDKLYVEDQLHFWNVYAQGKRANLLLDIPYIAYLTKNKPSFGKPGGFCTFLRKRLQKGFIRSIEQVRFDRIIKFVIQTETIYHVYVELFGKGNFVLCDEQDIILSAQDSIEYQDRSLKRGAQYVPPPPQPELPELTERALQEHLSGKPVEKALARIGLGQHYAAYVLEQAGIDPKSTDAAAADILPHLHALLTTTAPVHTDDAAFILPLARDATPTESFSEAISAVLDPKRHLARQQEHVQTTKKKQSKYERMVEKQAAQVKKLERQEQEDQRRGELLYEHYQEFQVLIAQAAKDRKALSPKAFKEKYAQHALVKNPDPQQFTVRVEDG